MNLIAQTVSSWTRRFALGLALGGLAGLLTAPQRGQRTREMLEDTGRVLGQTGTRLGRGLQSSWNLLRHRLESVDTDELRERQQEIMRDAQAASRLLRQRAEEASQRIRRQAEEARRNLERPDRESVVARVRSEPPRRRRLPGSFIVGGLIGATVGLLYAPKRGAQTRQQLAQTGRELRQKAAPAAGRAGAVARDVAERSRPLVEQTRERLAQGAEEAQKRAGPTVERVGKVVRERVQQVKDTQGNVVVASKEKGASEEER